MGSYRTSDGRFISLVLLQSDRHWADLVKRLGVAELVTYLCSAEASFINGASLTMDGGWSAR